ncbi:hypothetical protein GGI35DRAFT_448973 [Trichoderma velutinum]
MDYRLLRRVAVARLLDPDEIEDVIIQQGRDKRYNECNAHRGIVMQNDAFLGLFQRVVP